MSDAELAAIWARRPNFPQTAGDMEFIRVAKERRYRRRFSQLQSPDSQRMLNH
jgi:hypothetical protein